MSFLSNIIAGLSKAESFVINVFTKVAKIDATFVALAPVTKAAMLAVFYDIVKTEQSVQGVIATAEGGAPLEAITLSATTYALIKQLVVDVKNAEQIAVADFKALGLDFAPPATNIGA